MPKKLYSLIFTLLVMSTLAMLMLPETIPGFTTVAPVRTAEVLGTSTSVVVTTPLNDNTQISLPAEPAFQTTLIAGQSGEVKNDETENVPETVEVATVMAPPPSPSPTPLPAAPTLAPHELDALFQKYGAEYGVSWEKLKVMAKCESGYRADAIGGGGRYGGMYQYMASTWSSTRSAMGLDPNPDLRFNAEEAIRTTAWKIAQGGIGAWPHCGKL